MKKAVKITAALAALMLVFAFSACGESVETQANDEEAVRALIAECEDACRALDLDRVLKTLDPKVEKTVKRLNGLAETVTGVEGLTFDTLFRLIGGEGLKFTGEEISKALSDLKAEVGEIALNDGKAEAKTNLSLGDGSDFSLDIIIKCKKSGGKWYITGIKMPKEEE